MSANNEEQDEMIDLHYYRLQEAANTCEKELARIQNGIRDGSIEPNHSGREHVFKIICGFGRGSEGQKGILKHRIKDLVRNIGYDSYYIDQHGVILVRLLK